MLASIFRGHKHSAEREEAPSHEGFRDTRFLISVASNYYLLADKPLFTVSEPRNTRFPIASVSWILRDRGARGTRTLGRRVQLPRR